MQQWHINLNNKSCHKHQTKTLHKSSKGGNADKDTPIWQQSELTVQVSEMKCWQKVDDAVLSGKRHVWSTSLRGIPPNTMTPQLMDHTCWVDQMLQVISSASVLPSETYNDGVRGFLGVWVRVSNLFGHSFWACRRSVHKSLFHHSESVHIQLTTILTACT